MKILTYDTTKDMVDAHKTWFDSINKDRDVSLLEYHQILCEIRDNYYRTTDDMRHFESLKDINEELTYLQKSMTMFERFMPHIKERAERIVWLAFNHLGLYRDFRMIMDFGNFTDVKDVNFQLNQVSENKRMLFVSNDPARLFCEGFDSSWLDMSDEKVIEQIKKHVRSRGFTS